MNGGGEPKTDRFPVLQQSPPARPHSTAFITFVWGLIAVAAAVAVSVMTVSTMETRRTPEAPSTMTYVIIKEVPVPPRVEGTVQVVTRSASPSSVLPSMESSSVAPTSTVNTTTSEPSSTATLPGTASPSPEPKVVTVEQVPVETTTVESPVTQAEQP